MRYASVCSGVEAASLAWEILGWEPAWFAQFDPEHNYKQGPDFPSAVLKARWPHVPNLGDMTKLATQDIYQNEEFDILVGGTPCQDDSIAGKRKGMDGKRGIIKNDYVRILKEKQPRWFVWENVPGVLSSNGGKNFSTFIGNLKAVGYSFCWRIIDAQYCGVPQRRRRVFIVGYLGDDWRPSAAVLFERQSMPGYFKPSGKTEKEPSRSTGFSVKATSEGGLKDVTMSITVPYDAVIDMASKPLLHLSNDVQRYTPEIAHCLQTTCNDYSRADGFNMVVRPINTLTRGHSHGVHYATAFAQNSRNELRLEGGDGQRTGCLSASSSAKPGQGHPTIYTTDNVVRRLTEVEGERLQGMPDHHTNIMWKGKPAPAGQRYKAIGNSMATVAMHWIGKRIDFVDGVINGSI